MTDAIVFTVYATPTPQGSMKAFVRGGKARLTSDNRKLKPYRQEVAGTALSTLEGLGIALPFAGKHVPVQASYTFFLSRPPSIPKKRTLPAVKPDLDKLIRSTSDALTGILWADDGQVTNFQASKFYGSPERVEIRIALLGR